MRRIRLAAAIVVFLTATATSVSSDASIDGLDGRFYFRPTVERRRNEASVNINGNNQNLDTPSSGAEELNRKFVIDSGDFQILDAFKQGNKQEQNNKDGIFERKERADDESNNARSQQLQSGGRLLVKSGKSAFEDRFSGSSNNRSSEGLLPRAALKAAHGDDYGLHYGLGFKGYDRFYGPVADPHYRPLAKDLLDHHSHHNLYDLQAFPDKKYYNYGKQYDHYPAYSWASGCFRRDGYGCKFDPWFKYGEEYKRRYHYDRYYDLYKYARRFYPEYTAYKLRGRDALVRCSFPGANIIGDVAWYPPGRYNDNYGRYRSYASRETAIMEIRDYDHHDFGAYRCYAKIRRHYSPGYYTEYVYQDVHFFPYKDHAHDPHHHHHHDHNHNQHYDDYDYKLPYGRNRYLERHLYD